MPIDQLCMSLMAVLMLVAAVMGTNIIAGPTADASSPPKRSVLQSPEQPMLIEGEVQAINVKELEIVVMVQDVKTSFKATPSVQVTKDKQSVEFGALAKGDYVVLTLANSGSKLVTRIEAVSSR